MNDRNKGNEEERVRAFQITNEINTIGKVLIFLII